MREAKSKILIVDDESRNRTLLSAILKNEKYDTCEASNGAESLLKAVSEQPDLILLDVMMPVMDGYQVAQELKRIPETLSIPIIMVTALSDRDSRLRGLEAGAEEFLSKPVDRLDLKIRVRNLIKLKQMHDELRRSNQTLEKLVAKRTQALEVSFSESIFVLMRAAEFRDDDTGAHVARISHYCKHLSKILGMDKHFCDDIFYASPMHDIGKIGIPDHILLKPGSFTPEEWKIMQSHTIIGAKILENVTSPYLQMGRRIALSHHERWDGGGYPHGLEGEGIPIEARIMQVCDVYDALRSKRPYKELMDHDTVMSMLSQQTSQSDAFQFDPNILNVFIENHQLFEDLFEGAHR
ncbi:MAG: response regulator [Mariprofundaceae bacterium]|nr:response regulator [Mariprofundaceae bacterium]